MKKTKISLSFSPLTVGYVFLRDFPARIFPWSAFLSLNLRKAEIRISHVVYISSMFFWTIIIAVITYIVAASLLITVLPMIGMTFSPLYMVLIPILATASAAALSMTSFIYYPIYVASGKGREIERNLVYTSNYMSVMANSGATVEQIFESLAKHGEIFGVSNIARNVIRDVEILGKDIVSALNDAGKSSPSHEFAELIQGFIATMKTGGSLGSYLSVMANEFIESRRRLLAKLIDQLSLAGEIYISALVVLPVIMITMFSIMGAIPGGTVGGLAPAEIMPLLIYILVPFMAVGVILYIDAIMASW